MTPKKKNVILLVMAIIAASLFVFYGLNSKNIDFFLPRRLKKISAMLITSFCIGYSSVTFQTITDNKILTPSVMGLESLYLFVQTFIVFFFGSKQLTMMTDLNNFFLSLAIMIAASCLLFLFLFSKKGTNIFFLVLAGMILGSFFSGLATFMQVLLDPNEFLILQGSMFASFTNINNSLIVVSAIIVGAILLFTCRDYKKLDVVALGADTAVNLGIHHRKFILKHFIVISVLVSVSTALTGPITFLGILLASLSRELLKTYHHSTRIVGATLIGAFSLILGQFLVEKVFSFNTTISVILNFIGGIYFIYLMLKEAKR